MTATEINSALGLPKQTVHRLCRTLEEEGFLTRDGESRRYQPSRRLRDLGAGLLSHSRMHIARRQILLEVSREVGETVNFAVPEDDGMSYVDRVETDWAFRIQLPIGTRVPFHCTASGKCFLSSLAPRQRRALVASLKLGAMTANTHTSPESLLADLDRIGARGFSLDEEEFMDGMVAVSVPVRNASGMFVAALACHGPTQRFSIDQAIAHKGVLQQAAARLTDVLFSNA